MHRGAIFLALLALTACSSSDSTQVADINYMDANEWQVGPIINGINFSHNVSLRPIQSGNTWYIQFPNQGGVHYVTTDTTPLTPKNSITLDYTEEMDPGAKFVASSDNTSPGIGPTIYFQRCNDNWSGQGGYMTYRWWAAYATPPTMTAGRQIVTVPLSGVRWAAEDGGINSDNDPTDFKAAVNDMCRIGFTFGGGTGLGHGAYVTGGQARFIVNSFKVN